MVNGHAGISPEMATRLDKAFGGGANMWYRLQGAYDLAQAMKRAGQIKVECVSTVAQEPALLALVRSLKALSLMLNPNYPSLLTVLFEAR